MRENSTELTEFLPDPLDYYLLEQKPNYKSGDLKILTVDMKKHKDKGFEQSMVESKAKKVECSRQQMKQSQVLVKYQARFLLKKLLSSKCLSVVYT